MTFASALNPAFSATLLSRIEDAGLNASAPPQQRWVDGWLVRFSPGKAKRARCINAVADGRMPVADRLAACEQLYAGAGLPMIVRITPFSLPESLDVYLDEQGLQRLDDTRVMVLAEGAERRALSLPAGLSILPIGLEAFAQAVGGLRGSPLAQRQAHAERLLNSPALFSAFELRAQGQLAACGQLAFEGELVGLYDIFIAPELRGRGLAGALCSRMIDRAIAHGARHTYLQVEADNHAARSVYHRLGFVDGYAYHYRSRDPAAA